MKTKITTLICIAVTIVAAAAIMLNGGASSARADSPTGIIGSTKSVYKIVVVDGSSYAAVEAQFNKLGADGWELVEWGGQPTAVFRK